MTSAPRILGISAYYHDSAAALLVGGEIVAAAHEERFTRKKHDAAFPHHAARFCLDYAGLPLENIDAVVFYDKPFLKFERLLETYYAFAPKGIASFVTALPVWLKEKLFLKSLLSDELERLEDGTEGGGGGFDGKLLFSGHHLSHAASAYYPSPFDEAAVLSIDGVGEWSTASISHGRGRELTMLKELRFPHSVGLLYSAFTYYLGFKVNSGEYKLMGLSPYGDPSSPRVAQYKKIILDNLMEIKPDGSIWLNMEHFDYATGLRMVPDAAWARMFGFPRREAEGALEQHHADLALAIQQLTEEIVIRMGRTAQKLTGSRNLCLAGGVALNCVANHRLLREGVFDGIWVQPASGDAGGALGAAYAIHHQYYGSERVATKPDAMKGSYLGPEYSDKDAIRVANRFDAPYEVFKDKDELCAHVAGLIDKGNVVGWMQGRMEWGPRALGARSIIADARNSEMQKRLNLKIKFREGFRPFAPSVLAEAAGEYFNPSSPSPYMLFVADVLESRRNPLPEGYHNGTYKDKLYFLRSDIPSVTHLDYSARLQTVHEETNPVYHKLISKFRELTGYGLIVNTSFNVRGEPIVMSPEDAYRCFMKTEMDYLVVENVVFDKRNQPEWHEKLTLKDTEGLD